MRYRTLTDPVALARWRFEYHQRTSMRNGILKAEATLRFAETLGAQRIEYLQDVVSLSATDEYQLRARIEGIPGQRNCWDYFRISAGSEDEVTATRMIQRFVATAVQREVSPAEHAFRLPRQGQAAAALGCRHARHYVGDPQVYRSKEEIAEAVNVSQGDVRCELFCNEMSGAVPFFARRR